MPYSETSEGFELPWDPVPSYIEFLRDSVHFITESSQESLRNSVNWQLKPVHLIFVFLSFLFWTLVRRLVNKHVAKSVGRKLHLYAHGQYELETNLWALVYNVVAWPILFYSVYVKHELFQKPSTVWDGCCGATAVPWDLELNYLIWSGYVIHLMYALYVIENWAKDSFLYTAHHGVTLALLFLSYGLGYQKIGLLVLILLESTNIPFKAMKCLSSIRLQHGHEVPIIRKSSTFLLYLFGYSWFQFRLYWYPLKAVYAAGPIPTRLGFSDKIPYQYTCVVMLQFLLVLNFFWFLLIVKLIWKVSTGQPRDPRKNR